MESLSAEKVESIGDAAGAGFRLSLILNAIKMSMNSAGSEITRISKAVSDFSLMLKQVALAMEQNGEHESTAIASGLAVDTVFDIKQHSDLIFRDIKSMTDLSQFRDESGQLTEIGVGRKVSWTLKHSRVPYLLGQLEYLKLNLAIILQILQLAESIRHSRRPPTPKKMMQERAEVQNMIVLQHWSFEELRSLYSMAKDDTSGPDNEPSNAIASTSPDRDDEASVPRVRIIPEPSDDPQTQEKADLDHAIDPSTQLTPLSQHPLRELDESLHVALTKENIALGAPVADIIEHLLSQWTLKTDETGIRNLHESTNSNRRYQVHVSDDDDEEDMDEEDTTESDLDDSRGREPRRRRYISNWDNAPNGVRKSVRYRDKQARVEDGPDENENSGPAIRRGRGPPSRHVIDSDNESTESSGSSVSPPPAADSRRHRRRQGNGAPLSDTSESSTHSGNDEPQSLKPNERSRRPYNSGPAQYRETVSFRPNRSPAIPVSKPGASPLQRAGHFPSKQSTRTGVNVSSNNNNRAPTPNPRHAQSVGNSPRINHATFPGPQPPSHPGYPQRASPNMPQGAFGTISQHQRPAPTLHSHSLPHNYSQHQPHPSSRSVRANNQMPTSRWYDDRGGRDNRDGRGRHERDKKNASNNLKKGIGLGAAAAGLMELLSGLDGI